MASRIDTWVDRGYSRDEARLLLIWIDAEKQRLLRAPRMGIGTTAEKLNVRRRVRNVLQRKLRRFKNYTPSTLPKVMLAAKFKESPLLDGILPSRKSTWIPVLKRTTPEELPQLDLTKFTFVGNPIGTMEMLSRILEMECKQAKARLNFLDSECLDVGSFLVLQAIRKHMAPVFAGGTMAVDTQQVIDAVGLRSALRMAPFKRDPKKSPVNQVWPFGLRQRRGASHSADWQVEPQTKEIVADKFIATVDEWLSVVANEQLTRDGRRLVQKIVGEALDNAERHSRPNSDDGDGQSPAVWCSKSKTGNHSIVVTWPS